MRKPASPSWERGTSRRLVEWDAPVMAEAFEAKLAQ
jgi:hypothetical protein